MAVKGFENTSEPVSFPFPKCSPAQALPPPSPWQLLSLFPMDPFSYNLYFRLLQNQVQITHGTGATPERKRAFQICPLILLAGYSTKDKEKGQAFSVLSSP